MSRWSAFRSAVYMRCGGQCEARMSSRCTGVADEVHHRKLRSRGGKDEAANGVGVCQECHVHFHQHVFDATEVGWLVPSWQSPSEVPVFRRGLWVLLDDEGGLAPAEVPE